MSLLSSGSGFPPELICIVDTSILIAMKRMDLVPIKEQWPLFNVMSGLVAEGHLAFPRQVAREMGAAKHPDTPGAWVASCNGQARYPQPTDESLAEVLGAAQLTDPDSEDDYEVADPYVAAMAWELAERHSECRVVVATNDYVDRMPAKEALATACDRLGIESWKAEVFVAWLRKW